eukprot:CAMPEP_0177209784 /NCGR_PEP_ID=MMETSP0367-20130122/31208_1 /TAXON_ID=447022 ORGANISM="Scrippsiella hangoei-like, Strain SHHI-4" /NCGR_SAMPLE_ID=MMETSP0367 /ASSEMBLY_ACC=CAM_ASM_000362 /LENGTH=36 /DNA_ID= /DNA_START= /DNA_END= /DNA_ORIENTATION=
MKRLDISSFRNDVHRFHIRMCVGRKSEPLRQQSGRL